MTTDQESQSKNPSLHIQDSFTLNMASIPSSHIQDSLTLNMGSIPPVASVPLSNDISPRNGFLSCFVRVLKALLYPFYWLLKKFLLFVGCYFLFVAVILVVCIFGSLSSLTFPFLLAALLVLRMSQFIKRGEEYDKVTQVKVLVEWYMVVNCVLLALGIFLLCTLSKGAFGIKNKITISGKSIYEWVKLICITVLFLFGFRFILFWIIQKFMPRMTLEHNESGLKVIQATSDIVDGVLFWLLGNQIIISLPEEKKLGSAFYNWIGVSISVVIGCNIIALSTHLIVWLIHRFVSRYLDPGHEDRERSHRYLLLEKLLSVKVLVYYSNGMKRSFNFMLSSLLLLLIWFLYFRPHLRGVNYKDKSVGDFGTWTCVVLLILSCFWVLKDSVLLLWEANAVYDRLSKKISEARKSLYFLGILGRHSHDILKLRYEVVHKGNDVDSSKNWAQFFMAKNFTLDAYYQEKSDEDDNDNENNEILWRGNNSQLKPKLSTKKRTRVKKDLILLKDDSMTLFNIQQMGQYFFCAATALSQEMYTSDILKKLTHDDNREILEKLIVGRNDVSVRRQDWEDFKGLLNLEPDEIVCHNKLKTWVERSHNKCLFLANTLRSAKEVVDCLDNIISVLLICASVILWLIFTRLTDVKVLVLLASPLLAATFVFGDTCKNMFQGIIFVYVVHPFDVGDLCVIDEKMLEVKSIGVWKTTFSNIDEVGTHEEVMYPNLELGMKTIINHKTEFDWKDSVDFDVEHLDKQQIEEFKKQIEDHLVDTERDKSMPGSHSVSVISTGKDIKIVVHLRHNKRNADMTYFECVKEKDNLRSTFILNVRNLADLRSPITN